MYSDFVLYCRKQRYRFDDREGIEEVRAGPLADIYSMRQTIKEKAVDERYELWPQG